jgi:hypothetical protein
MRVWNSGSNIRENIPRIIMNLSTYEVYQFQWEHEGIRHIVPGFALEDVHVALHPGTKHFPFFTTAGMAILETL